MGENLPGYVVLTGGRGTSGAATLWSSGFLSSSHSGVLFRNRGEAVPNLAQPARPGPRSPPAGLDALGRPQPRARPQLVRDPEIDSRTASLRAGLPHAGRRAGTAWTSRARAAATLDMYGVDRPDPPIRIRRDGGPGQYRDFASNCLLARRLVERGVRFVNIFPRLLGPSRGRRRRASLLHRHGRSTCRRA